MIPEYLDPLLVLFALAAAVGLSAYASLATAGIVFYFGLHGLQPPLAGLAAPQIWGVLLGLLAVEWLAGGYRFTDLAWNIIHTLVRPLAAALVVAAGLFTAPEAAQWLAALAGFAVAFAVHAPVLAIRTAARTAGPNLNPILLTAVQSVLAAGLTVLALLKPVFGAAVAGLLLMLPLPWLPFVSGAAQLALAAAAAALTALSRTRRWESGPDRLPRRLRGALEAELGHSVASLRWTRVALARVGRRRPFYRGRLLLGDSGPLFAHRRWFRPAVVPLGRGRGRSDQALLVETVEVEASEPYALCLTRAAPHGTAILAELERSTRSRGTSGPRGG